MGSFHTMVEAFARDLLRTLERNRVEAEVQREVRQRLSIFIAASLKEHKAKHGQKAAIEEEMSHTLCSGIVQNVVDKVCNEHIPRIEQEAAQLQLASARQDVFEMQEKLRIQELQHFLDGGSEIRSEQTHRKFMATMFKEVMALRQQMATLEVEKNLALEALESSQKTIQELKGLHGSGVYSPKGQSPASMSRIQKFPTHEETILGSSSRHGSPPTSPRAMNVSGASPSGPPGGNTLALFDYETYIAELEKSRGKDWPQKYEALEKRFEEFAEEANRHRLALAKNFTAQLRQREEAIALRDAALKHARSVMKNLGPRMMQVVRRIRGEIEYNMQALRKFQCQMRDVMADWFKKVGKQLLTIDSRFEVFVRFTAHFLQQLKRQVAHIANKCRGGLPQSQPLWHFFLLSGDDDPLEEGKVFWQNHERSHKMAEICTGITKQFQRFVIEDADELGFPRPLEPESPTVRLIDSSAAQDERSASGKEVNSQREKKQSTSNSSGVTPTSTISRPATQTVDSRPGTSQSPAPSTTATVRTQQSSTEAHRIETRSCGTMTELAFSSAVPLSPRSAEKLIDITRQEPPPEPHFVLSRQSTLSEGSQQHEPRGDHPAAVEEHHTAAAVVADRHGQRRQASDDASQDHPVNTIEKATIDQAPHHGNIAATGNQVMASTTPPENKPMNKKPTSQGSSPKESGFGLNLAGSAVTAKVPPSQDPKTPQQTVVEPSPSSANPPRNQKDVDIIAPPSEPKEVPPTTRSRSAASSCADDGASATAHPKNASDDRDEEDLLKKHGNLIKATFGTFPNPTPVAARAHSRNSGPKKEKELSAAAIIALAAAKGEPLSKEEQNRLKALELLEKNRRQTMFNIWCRVHVRARREVVFRGLPVHCKNAYLLMVHLDRELARLTHTITTGRHRSTAFLEHVTQLEREIQATKKKAGQKNASGHHASPKTGGRGAMGGRGGGAGSSVPQTPHSGKLHATPLYGGEDLDELNGGLGKLKAKLRVDEDGNLVFDEDEDDTFDLLGIGVEDGGVDASLAALLSTGAGARQAEHLHNAHIRLSEDTEDNPVRIHSREPQFPVYVPTPGHVISNRFAERSKEILLRKAAAREGADPRTAQTRYQAQAKAQPSSAAGNRTPSTPNGPRPEKTSRASSRLQ